MKYLGLLCLVVFSFSTRAQLSGTVNIPTSAYPTLQSALAAVNSQSLGAGGLTINILSGYTEAVPAGGYSLAVSGTSLHPLLITRTGAGAKPLFVAYTGVSTPGSSLQDGLFRFIGCDYVIVDGLSFKDPNTSPPQTMEFGFGFFKASVSKGCQHNTIRNCEITLSINNNANGSGPAADGSRGIEFVNALSSSHTTSLSVVSPAGSHSFNKLVTNTVSGTNYGIVMTGFNDQPPYLNADRGNAIGGSLQTDGNYLVNFGGGGTLNACAAVKTSAQYDLFCGCNRVKNNDGNGSDHLVTMRGLQFGPAPGANITVRQNTVTLSPGGSSSQVLAIENTAGSSGTSNTVSITFNDIFQCTYQDAVAGSFYGISNNASAAHVFISNNRFRENSSGANSGSGFLIACNGVMPSDLRIKNNELGFYLNGTASFAGTMYGIYLSGTTSSDTAEISGNHFQDFSFENTATSSLYFIYNVSDFSQLRINENKWRNLFLNTSGAQYFIYNNSSTAHELAVCDNSVTSVNRAGGTGITAFYYGSSTSPATAVQTFSGNLLSEIGGGAGNTGNFYGIYNTEGNTSPYPRKLIHSNQLTNIQFPTTGVVHGFYLSDLGDGGSGAGSSVHSNTLLNMTGGDNAYGIYLASPVSPAHPVQIHSNTAGGIFSPGVSSSVYGIYVAANNAGTEIFRNRIFDISSGGNSSLAYGLYFSTVNSATVHNNAVSHIQSAGTGNSRANGIYISSSGSYFLFYNSVYLDATSSAAHFGSNALYASTTASLTLRNNILFNLSVQTGTGICTAYRRSSTNLSSYQSASDNNLLYAGTPSSNRVLMHNGSSGYQTLSAYKAAVSPRDNASLTNTLSFQSLAGNSVYFLHLAPTVSGVAESNGSVIVQHSLDIDQQLRQGASGYSGTGTQPDIGADEVETNTVPCSGLLPGVVPNSIMICEGELFSVHAYSVTPGSGVTFQWQMASTANGSYSSVLTGTGVTESEYFSPPMNAGIYFYRLQNACATNSLSGISNVLTVSVSALPNFSIAAGKTTLCVNDTLVLAASGNATGLFEWRGPAGYYSTGNTMKRTALSKNKAGTYSVTCTMGTCSAPVKTVQVQVSDPELKLYSSDDMLCAGKSATLFATSTASSFSWSSSVTTASMVVSPTVNTVYSVSVKDTASCFSEKTFLLPVVNSTIQGVGAVACGIPGTATLSVKAFTPSLVSWYGSPTSTVALSNSLSFSVSANTSTTFFAQSNSSSTGTFFVSSGSNTLSPGIMFDLVASTKIELKNIGVLFSGVGNAGYEIWWRGSTHQGATSSSAGWNQLVAGTVAVTSATALIYLPLGAGLAVLKGQTVSLYVASGSSNSISLGQGNLVGSTFTQSKDLKIKEGSGGNYFNCTVSPLRFFGEIRYNIPGCESPRIPVTMTVSTVPQLTLSSSVPQVCPGKPVSLIVQGALTYSWTGVGSGSMVSVMPVVTKIYTVTGTNSVGCKSSSTLQLNTLAVPLLSVFPLSATVCPLQVVSFSASGAASYTWNTGPNGSIIQVNPVSSGTLLVQGSNSLGCIASQTAGIVTLTTPVISVQANTTTTCPGETVTLNAQGALSYTWLPGGEKGNSIQVSPGTTSVYNAIGLGVNGCTNVAYVVIDVSGCVSLPGETTSSLLYIYPNPSDGKFIIKGPGGDYTLNIQDVFGKTVMHKIIAEESYLLDLSILPAGCYFLRVSGQGWRSEKKLIRE